MPVHPSLSKNFRVKNIFDNKYSKKECNNCYEYICYGCGKCCGCNELQRSCGGTCIFNSQFLERITTKADFSSFIKDGGQLNSYVEGNPLIYYVLMNTLDERMHTSIIDAYLHNKGSLRIIKDNYKTYTYCSVILYFNENVQRFLLENYLTSRKDKLLLFDMISHSVNTMNVNQVFFKQLISNFFDLIIEYDESMKDKIDTFMKKYHKEHTFAQRILNMLRNKVSINTKSFSSKENRICESMSFVYHREIDVEIGCKGCGEGFYECICREI